MEVSHVREMPSPPDLDSNANQRQAVGDDDDDGGGPTSQVTVRRHKVRATAETLWSPEAVGIPTRLRVRRGDGLRSISLFTGAGGLDLGLSRAGGGEIQFGAWVEKDEDSRETIALNHPTGRDAIFGDITKVHPTQLMQAAGLSRGQAFLVAGGPPCQAFSTAGLRQSIHEPRGQVVDRYFDIIREVRPRFFVFENVRGLASVAIKHRRYVDRIASEKENPGEPDLEADQRLGSVFDQVSGPT